MHRQMLTEADVRILDVSSVPTSISDIANQTGYSRGYVSERVAHLENFDLVQTVHRGRTKTIQTVQTAMREAYHDLTTSQASIDYPSLISPSMLRVCWFLDRPTTVSEIEQRLTLRRRRIYQLLEQLQSRGFISKNGNHYVLTDRQKGLAQFAKAVIKYEPRHRIHSHLTRAAIVWTGPHEALITVEDESLDDVQELDEDQQQWHATGLARFAEYGLEFFTSSPQPYFYSALRETLQPADFIAHTLILETDTRNVSYCALLMTELNLSGAELRTSAGYYGIEETINDLVQFLETRGEADIENTSFPDWQEMQSLAKQYEVDL